MKVLFIGTGQMGAPMASNLVKAGHEVTVYNRTASKLEPIVALGAQAAASPREGGAGQEAICLSVTNPEAVRTVLLGEKGALGAAPEGCLVLDFSTVDPETSKSMSHICEERGVTYLDAPVSGGIAGAQAGTLTIIAGGEKQAFERAMPILDALGSKMVHVGPSGAGSVIKLINQILVGVNLMGIIEAFVAANAAGVDLQTLYDVLSTSAGGSASLNYAVPDFIIPRRFREGFSVDMLCKDLDLALQMSRDLRTSLLMPATARQMFELARSAGLGDWNVTSATLALEAVRKAQELAND